MKKKPHRNPEHLKNLQNEFAEGMILTYHSEFLCKKTTRVQLILGIRLQESTIL